MSTTIGTIDDYAPVPMTPEVWQEISGELGLVSVASVKMTNPTTNAVLNISGKNGLLVRLIDGGTQVAVFRLVPAGDSIDFEGHGALFESTVEKFAKRVGGKIFYHRK